MTGDTKDFIPLDLGSAFQCGFSKRELFSLVAMHALIKPEMAF